MQYTIPVPKMAALDMPDRQNGRGVWAKIPASHVMLKMAGASLHIQEVREIAARSSVLSNRPGVGKWGSRGHIFGQ